MKLAQALEVKVGMTLASPYTTPSLRPHKVKQVWISHDRRHVRFQLTRYADRWLDHENWILVPEVGKWVDSIPGRQPQWMAGLLGGPLTLKLEKDPEPEVVDA